MKWDLPSPILSGRPGKLKDAKRSGRMPGPDEAAEIVAKSLVKALEQESGSFLDVRDMD